jgi:hypothetical protein
VDSVELAVSCDTEGATIHYTLDGTDPTETSTLYSTPIAIETTDTVVKAIAIHSWHPVLEASNVTVSEAFTIKASSPAIHPDQGAFTGEALVQVISSTAGAEIRCTLDGSEPTADTPVCTSPVSITETGTLLKAVATRDGLTVSDVASMTSAVVIKAVPPKTTPNGGKYTNQVSVAMSCESEGCTIHYTTDGGVPTSASTVYTEPLVIETTGTVVRAISVAPGKSTSDLFVSGEYQIEADAPTFSANGTAWGTPDNTLEYYVEDASITMETTTPHAEIFYTTDMSPPTVEVGTKYDQAYLDTSLGRQVVKARAYAPGKLPSPISSSLIYDIVRRTSTPVILPHSGGPFTGQVEVTLEDADHGKIYMTLDGSEPTRESELYTGPFVISTIGETEVRVVATQEHQADSNLVSTTFLVLEQVKKPTFSPASGFFIDTATVRIECATEDATIRYTTDGSRPNAASPEYNPDTGIVLGLTADGEENFHTVKAIAMKPPDMGDSVVASSGRIVVQPQVDAPVISPGYEGPYKEYVQVEIVCATEGATIHFTTDGQDPTSASPIYAGHVQLVETGAVVKAKAFAEHMAPSEISESVTFILATYDPAFQPGKACSQFRARLLAFASAHDAKTCSARQLH